MLIGRNLCVNFGGTSNASIAWEGYLDLHQYYQKNRK